MTTAEDSSFDEILNGKPTLAELCADVPISTNWYIMGTQLKLDVRKLNEIEDLPKPVPYKVSKMYELWLDTKLQATRRQVLDTLKMEAVGQMSLAQQYETKLKDHISVIAGETPNEPSATLQPVITNLSSLLGQYGLSYEEVEKECDDGLFIEVSQHMNDDYVAAGHCLNLSTERVCSISQSDKSDVQKKIEVLWAWKRKNGTSATSKELVIAFLKMEDRFVAESILKYLSKRTTSSLPQATMFHLAPEKAKCRYPNWENLTESEQEAVRNQLMDDNRDVREAYAVFVAKLIKSFQKREVDPKIIMSIVHSYCTSEKGQHQLIEFDFRRDGSVSDVFLELSKHCTWFNYDALRVIVKILGNECEREFLKEYEDSNLIPYLKRSIFEIPCTPPNQSQHTKLLFKVSEDLTITGREIKAIQRNLAKLLGFQSDAILHFHDYNEGCIELVFSLPTVVLEKSSPESKLFTYIEWDKSSQSYEVNVDLVAVLAYSEKPEVSLLVKLLQEKEDALNEFLEREKTKQTYSMENEGPQDHSSTDTLSEKLKVLEKMNKAKTLEIEKLTTHKETTDKVLVEKQEEIEALQMEIKSLDVQLMEREESGISQLMEKMKDPRILDTKLKKTVSLEISQLKSTQKGDTGSVKWTSNSVKITSATVAECKEVMHQLKRQQNTTWNIELNSLSPQSLKTLLTDINECQVRKLYIGNTHFDSICVSHLSQVVTYNKTMEFLTLDSSHLLPDTYKLLTTNNKVIKILTLYNDNNITDKDIPHFCHLMTDNQILQELYFANCPKITNFGKQQLQNACARNTSLNTLYINGTYLRR